MTACPDETLLLGLVDRSLPEDRGGDVRSHIDDCDACRETVALLIRERREAEAVTPSPLGPLALLATLGRAAILGRADAQASSPAPTRALLGDRFEVGETIGRGGQAVVHRAHDRLRDATVALKMVSNAGGRARLDEEAALLATVD